MNFLLRSGTGAALLSALLAAAAGRAAEVGLRFEQVESRDYPIVVRAILTTDTALRGIELGFIHESKVTFEDVTPGAGLPGSAAVYWGSASEAPCGETGRKGIVIAMLTSEGAVDATLPPGEHEILILTFQATDISCIPLGCAEVRLETCLGDPAAPIRNIATSADGVSIPYAAPETFCLVCPLPQVTFVRGEVLQDGGIDLSDAIAILQFLFAGAEEPDCLDAADVDDSEKLDITDAVRLLRWLFSGGEPPAPPSSGSTLYSWDDAGPDPERTGDPPAEALGCRSFVLP